MTIEQARERVASGAALLDQKRPGWAQLVDVGKLDLRNTCLCVIGQVCGEYYSGTERICASQKDACNHGYRVLASDCSLTDLPFGKRAYRTLQDAWIEAIADRLIPAEPAKDVHSLIAKQ